MINRGLGDRSRVGLLYRVGSALRRGRVGLRANLARQKAMDWPVSGRGKVSPCPPQQGGRGEATPLPAARRRRLPRVGLALRANLACLSYPPRSARSADPTPRRICRPSRLSPPFLPVPGPPLPLKTSPFASKIRNPHSVLCNPLGQHAVLTLPPFPYPKAGGKAATQQKAPGGPGAL
jgi:hypothetical protein